MSPRPLPSPRAMASLAVLAALFLIGCQPKETARTMLNDVGSLSKDAISATERLATKTGESVGLLKPQVDFVSNAWKPRTAPGDAPGSETLAYVFAEEREIGRAMAADLAGRYGLYNDEKLARYLTRIAAGLAAFSERPDLPVCVAVLRSEDVRVFEAPGGYVLVTIGALRIAESESELAGLLAAALSHVNLRHALATFDRLRKELPADAAKTPVLELANEHFSELVGRTASWLVKDGHTPEQIRAADRAATDLQVRLGYEPGGLRAYLTRANLRLKERHGTQAPDYESFKTRCADLDARVAELQAPANGHNLTVRSRRDCTARLPAPRSAP